MIIGLLVLLLIVAAVLLLLGFLIEDNWGYLGIAGAVLLIISGLFLAVDPLVTKLGETTILDDDNVTIVMTVDYEEVTPRINNTLWLVIMTVGLFLLILTVMNVRRIKKKELDEGEQLEFGLADNLRE